MSVNLSWRIVKSRAKHRGKTPGQLHAEITRLETESDALVCHLIAAQGDLRQTAFQLGAAVYERQDDQRVARESQDELVLVADERDRLKAELAEARAVSVPVIGTRDTSAIEDQATAPRGIPHVGDDFPDDYLDQMRTGWKPKPVGPAVLEVRLDEPTAEHRFPATASVTAPAELLSRMLADSGPSVTVGSEPREGVA